LAPYCTGLTFVTLLDEMPSPMKVVEMIQEVLGTGNDAV
jgi:hypothetical protein